MLERVFISTDSLCANNETCSIAPSGRCRGRTNILGNQCSQLRGFIGNEEFLWNDNRSRRHHWLFEKVCLVLGNFETSTTEVGLLYCNSSYKGSVTLFRHCVNICSPLANHPLVAYKATHTKHYVTELITMTSYSLLVELFCSAQPRHALDSSNKRLQLTCILKCTRYLTLLEETKLLASDELLIVVLISSKEEMEALRAS